MTCPACDIGGVCGYPSYGPAPHRCGYKDGILIGGSIEAPESQWPACFRLDSDEGPATGYPRCGTWLCCPECGDASKPGTFHLDLPEIHL